jgi:hypothetical protein
MRYGVLILVLGVLGTVSTARAENGYVSERLSVAMNPAPDDIGPPLKRLEAGTVVEVLARHDRFARVRDKQGVEGWIEARYLTAEAPARQQLAKLQEDLTKARGQLAEVQAKLKDSETALDQEARKSRELAKGLAEAKAAPPPASQPTPAPPVAPSDGANAAAPAEFRLSLGWLAISFAMLLVGFFAGARWVRESIRRRSGGMYLRV